MGCKSGSQEGLPLSIPCPSLRLYFLPPAWLLPLTRLWFPASYCSVTLLQVCMQTDRQTGRDACARTHMSLSLFNPVAGNHSQQVPRLPGYSVCRGNLTSSLCARVWVSFRHRLIPTAPACFSQRQDPQRRGLPPGTGYLSTLPFPGS